MFIAAALGEDYVCYCFSGDQVQRAYIIKDDPIMEHFELSRRKVLGKGWIFCDDRPPVEMDKECEDGCDHLDWRGL